jgi:hypothetical protein
MEGALKLLMIAVRIAAVWTLLSLLLTACWWLLLEAGRLFGSRSAAKNRARRKQQVSAEVTALYADFGHDGRGEALEHREPDEAAASGSIVRSTGSVRER